MKLAIYGAGGFGREMAVMLEQINQHQSTWDVVGFYDDALAKDFEVDGLKVLGGMDDINSCPNELSVCIAVADPIVRHRLVKKITNKKIDFPTLIHPEANMGDLKRNKFGKGCVIAAGTILTTGILLGDFCVVNLACTIGHDVKLGDYCTLMPGCCISGKVSVGAGCLFGTGSRIIQEITIGEHCFIGAGSVVTKSFESNLKLLGVPARKRAQHVEGI